jgi:CheY-like chemotaxis protein
MRKSPENNTDIAVVEDDAFTLKAIEEKFRISGIKPITFADGISALEYLKNHNPKVVLLDIMLPGMNGLDVLEALRKEGRLKDSPVIVFTALQDEEIRERAKSLGVTKFIYKAQVTLAELFGTTIDVMKKKPTPIA